MKVVRLLFKLNFLLIYTSSVQEITTATIMNTLAVAVFACLVVFASAKPSGLFLAEDDGQWRGEGLLESQWRGEGLLESQDLTGKGLIAGPGIIAGGGLIAPGITAAVAPGVIAPGLIAPGLVGPGLLGHGLIGPAVAPGLIAPGVAPVGLVPASAGAIISGPSGIVGPAGVVGPLGILGKKW